MGWVRRKASGRPTNDKEQAMIFSERAGHFRGAVLGGALCVLAASAASAATLNDIEAEINSVLNRSAVRNNQWTILVENTYGTTTLYERNPDTRRRPASNTKLFTSAAACIGAKAKAPAAMRNGRDFKLSMSCFL